MSEVAKAVRLFPAWLRHVFAAVIGIAAVLGAFETIFKVFNFPETYVAPTLVGLIFLGGSAFCIWILSDPKTAIATGQARESVFSPNLRRLAGVVIPVDLIIGGAAVFILLPKVARPIQALHEMVVNVDSLRNDMNDDSHGRLSLYKQYRDARAADGEQFWDNVTWAMDVHVSNVADHNQQLQDPIKRRIVPDQLTKLSDARRDFGWVRNDALASDFELVVGHFLEADQVRDKVNVIRETGNLGNYENAKALNQEICRYWELVLGVQKTNLTDADPTRLKGAEDQIRQWLSSQE